MSQILENPPAAPARNLTTRQSTNFILPVVNIRQDADGYSLEAEMPGVPKGGVEITFEDGKLTLVGHRSVERPSEGLVHRESPEASYRRAFDLDPSIDASRIEAAIEQGLLTVRLPKAETAKPRRISVS